MAASLIFDVETRRRKMRIVGIVIAVAIAAGALVSDATYAKSEEASESAKQEAQTFVDVGNKICPLTGEDVDGKTYAVYKGRRYGLCCQECGANFWQDPETYSMLAEKEVSGKK